jgi:hypothetical protein
VAVNYNQSSLFSGNYVDRLAEAYRTECKVRLDPIFAWKGFAAELPNGESGILRLITSFAVMNWYFASSAFRLLEQLTFSELPMSTRRYVPTAAGKICHSYLQTGKANADQHNAVINRLTSVFLAMERLPISPGLSVLASELVAHLRPLDVTTKESLVKTAKAITLQTTTLMLLCGGFLDLVVAFRSAELAGTLHQRTVDVMSDKTERILESPSVESLHLIAREILAAEKIFQTLLSKFGIALPNFVAVATAMDHIAVMFEGIGGFPNVTLVLRQWLSAV